MLPASGYIAALKIATGRATAACTAAAAVSFAEASYRLFNC